MNFDIQYSFDQYRRKEKIQIKIIVTPERNEKQMKRKKNTCNCFSPIRLKTIIG